MKQFICLLLSLLCFSVGWTQELNSLYKTKKVAVDSLTTFVLIDSVALNSSHFQLTDTFGQPVDSTWYDVNFVTAQIHFNRPIQDTLLISYLNFPSYLTQTYSLYNKGRIVPNEAGSHLFTIPEKKRSTYIPFDGLTTDGSITRGITVGSNQNLVTNSNLDLQITGKLSDKVSIRASIQDSNVPLQNGGYSQKMDEFDQIFIELFGTDWSIKAGDLFIENRLSRFLNFNKKVQGISTKFSFGNEEAKTQVEIGAALVRGQYAKSEFTGQEGNQGPYKLRGGNNELYILIISGSERVYVNGRLLTRGENKDYVIDYNSGEIRFTSLFPITADMRIAIEYQYTDRNYTRFLGYGGMSHQRKNWQFGGYVYTETDIKNQPLQQNLNKEQVEILKQAGNDPAKMMAPSAYEDSFSENKVLYKKVQQDGFDYFEYSSNPQDTLYMVTFSLVGNNQGNYVLANSASIGKIYQFVPPLNGIQQGSYEPVTRLVAPTRTTMATVMAKYNPNEKTWVDTELAFSNNDQNLFSDIDDQNNKGWAASLNAKQRILSGKWTIDAFSNVQFVHKNFKTIERLYTIEFDRDWGLDEQLGSQSLLSAGVTVKPNVQSTFTYQIDKLEFSESYHGLKNIFTGNYTKNNWNVTTNNSILKAKSNLNQTQFIRSNTKIVYKKNNYWGGGIVDLEDYQIKEVASQKFNPLSQKYLQADVFIARGDSARMFVEVGYQFRTNDSLQNEALQRVTQSNAFYVKSQLFKTKVSDLNIYANYRILDYQNSILPNENTLNSRIVYNDRFFKDLVQWSTIYETTSGSVAQQEFTYIEVEPGLGTHMWNDYNGNGIQELEEFEIAPYPDLAKYVRMYLPNQVYIKTHQNKFTQLLNINFSTWQNSNGIRRVLSLFHNQASYLIDRNILRNGTEIPLNPFSDAGQDLVSINSNFRNTLFFNRGKQRYTTAYSYIENRTKNLLNVGSLESKVTTHQLQFNHLVKKLWQYQLLVKYDRISSLSENYDSKNYFLQNYTLQPKISYLFSANASLDFFYEFKDKRNTKEMFETLKQHRLGTSFSYTASAKFSMNGEFSFYQNTFTGNPLSAVAYQMLEGLQPGKNITWRLLFQRNLTRYLDANISYQGRTSETAKTIHTGSIQLRAFF